MIYGLAGILVVIGFATFIYYIKSSSKNELILDQYKGFLKDVEDGQKKSAAIDVDTNVKRKLVSQWLRSSRMSSKAPKPMP